MHALNEKHFIKLQNQVTPNIYIYILEYYVWNWFGKCPRLEDSYELIGVYRK